MGIRTMKIDLFVIKAVESKGYTIDSITKLSNEELDELHLPTKIINILKEYKLRGGETPEQIAEKIADLMLEPDVQENVDITIQEYKTEEINIVEELEDSVPALVQLEETVIENDEVEIIRTIANVDDVNVIKEALNKKELKTTASYIKHLKTEVPAAILSSIDGSTLNDLIDMRLDELKKSTK